MCTSKQDYFKVFYSLLAVMNRCRYRIESHATNFFWQIEKFNCAGRNRMHGRIFLKLKKLQEFFLHVKEA